MRNATLAQDNTQADAKPRPHSRTTRWVGTTSVAMGGINKGLFLMSAPFIGREAIPGQGGAAAVLQDVGLLLISAGEDQ